MRSYADERLDSIAREKAAHYAVCSGCYTCKGAAGGFTAPVESDFAMVEAQADLPRGGGKPAPKIDVDGAVEAGVFLEGYTGSWQFMLTLQSELRTGKLRFTPRVVEVILNCKAREAAWAEQRAPLAKAIETAAAAPVAAPATEGWYEVDGSVVKVQRAVNGSGNLYAKRLVVTEGDGSWEYVPGLIRQCNDSNRLSAERAMAMGKLYGVCMICGRTLTDETSIERGIGPICLGKMEG